MLARGSISDPTLSNVSIAKFKKMVFSLQERSKGKSGLVKSAIEKVYQRRWVDSLTKKTMLDPCLAGVKLLILNEHGMLTPCELLESLRLTNRLNNNFKDDFNFGNLRDYDYNLNAILNTPKAIEIIKFIKNKGCWCSFECAMISNFVANPYNYLDIIGEIFRESLSLRKPVNQ
jgi:hypothetical protein